MGFTPILCGCALVRKHTEHPRFALRGGAREEHLGSMHVPLGDRALRVPGSRLVGEYLRPRRPFFMTFHKGSILCRLCWLRRGARPHRITRPSVDELRGEVEAADPAVSDVDEEPRFEEVLEAHRQRLRAQADLRPAVARLLPDPFVPDEPVPAVLAAARPRAVAGAERDRAPDPE